MKLRLLLSVASLAELRADKCLQCNSAVGIARELRLLALLADPIHCWNCLNGEVLGHLLANLRNISADHIDVLRVVRLGKISVKNLKRCIQGIAFLVVQDEALAMGAPRSVENDQRVLAGLS